MGQYDNPMPELTLSPSQGSMNSATVFTLTTTNADECFPNYSKMEQPIGKGRVQGRGMEGVGADFMSRHFIEHGQTHA